MVGSKRVRGLDCSLVHRDLATETSSFLCARSKNGMCGGSLDNINQ
jgi:hypothetical protein